MTWTDLIELLGDMREVDGDQPVFVWNQKDSTTFRVERMDRVGPWNVLVVNGKKPPYEDMDTYTATLIVEEVIEETDYGAHIRAWQHLVDTGACWDLQGRFGRMAVALIEDKVVSPIRMGDTGEYHIHPIAIARIFNKGKYTYKRIGAGISLNGYMCMGLPLYVWNDRGCKTSGGTAYADYVTINDTIIYLRDMEETDVREETHIRDSDKRNPAQSSDTKSN